jgi:chromosome segregation ATPase
MKIEITNGVETPVTKFFSATPETDVFFRKKGSWSDDILAFCRKMERERDEAREERDQLKQLLAADSERVDAYLGVCIERDEARADAAQLADRLSGLELRTTEELAKMEQERDEWRKKIDLSVDPVKIAARLAQAESERDEARSELSLKQQTLTIAEGTLSDLRKELKEWQTLCSWGGTLEHIHDFIKGQQTRIHQAQDIEKTCEQLEHSRNEWSAMCGRYKQERDIAEDERIDMAQQLESEKQCHDRCQNERDALVQKLDAWEEIAEHLHHLVQHPAYGVDQAIQRMDVLEAYKHLKHGH